MRLNSYLNEVAVKISDYDALVDYIKSHCKGAIKEYQMGRNIWWRNERFGSPVGAVRPVRKDRRPLDTPRFISKAMDDWFEKKFGWRPRSQGLFCWLSKIEAFHSASMGWENKYIVFPVDPYDYIYSPGVSDLYADVIINALEDMKPETSFENDEQIVTDALWAETWKTSGAMKQKFKYNIGVEIMINTSKAALVSKFVIHQLNLDLKLGINTIKFEKTYNKEI